MNKLPSQQAYKKLSPGARLLLGHPTFHSETITFYNLNHRVSLQLQEEGITANFDYDIIECFFWDDSLSLVKVFENISEWIEREFTPESQIVYSDMNSEEPYLIQSSNHLTAGSSGFIRHNLYWNISETRG
ncbi:hypothetical protein [Bdellovibrio bacteriovorus]|uniref:hypothetical protein n=1 Tax=Bdellovibrio bacteriovorus TaxID=959 RepID=UPI0035A596C0